MTWKDGSYQCDERIQRIVVYCPLVNSSTSNTKSFSTGIVVCGLKITLVAPEKGTLVTDMGMDGWKHTVSLLHSDVSIIPQPTLNIIPSDFFAEKYLYAINREWWGLLLNCIIFDRENLLANRGFQYIIEGFATYGKNIRAHYKGTYVQKKGKTHPTLHEYERGTQLRDPNDRNHKFATCTSAGSNVVWRSDGVVPLGSTVILCNCDDAEHCSRCPTIDIADGSVQMVLANIGSEHCDQQLLATFNSLKHCLEKYNRCVAPAQRLNIEAGNTGFTQKLFNIHKTTPMPGTMELYCDNYGKFTTDPGIGVRMLIARGLIAGPDPEKKFVYEKNEKTYTVLSIGEFSLTNKFRAVLQIGNRERMQHVRHNDLNIILNNNQTGKVTGMDDRHYIVTVGETDYKFKKLEGSSACGKQRIICTTFAFTPEPTKFFGDPNGIHYHMSYPDHKSKDPELTVAVHYAKQATPPTEQEQEMEEGGEHSLTDKTKKGYQPCGLRLSSGVPLSYVSQYSRAPSGREQATVHSVEYLRNAKKFSRTMEASLWGNPSRNMFSMRGNTGIISGPLGFNTYNSMFGASEKVKDAIENFFRFTEARVPTEEECKQTKIATFSTSFGQSHLRQCPLVELAFVLEITTNAKGAKTEYPTVMLGPAFNAVRSPENGTNTIISRCGPHALVRDTDEKSIFMNETVNIIGSSTKEQVSRTMRGQCPKDDKPVYSLYNMGEVQKNTVRLYTWTTLGTQFFERKRFKANIMVKPLRKDFTTRAAYEVATTEYETNDKAFKQHQKPTRGAFVHTLLGDAEYAKALDDYDAKVIKFQRKIPPGLFPWREGNLTYDENCAMMNAMKSDFFHRISKCTDTGWLITKKYIAMDETSISTIYKDEVEERAMTIYERERLSFVGTQTFESLSSAEKDALNADAIMRIQKERFTRESYASGVKIAENIYYGFDAPKSAGRDSTKSVQASRTKKRKLRPRPMNTVQDRVRVYCDSWRTNMSMFAIEKKKVPKRTKTNNYVSSGGSSTRPGPQLREVGAHPPSSAGSSSQARV